jgi:pimeloyl-ACP methyl ester carboxylesterase
MNPDTQSDEQAEERKMATATRPQPRLTQVRGADVEADSGWRDVELPGRGTTYAYDRPHPSPSAPTVVLLHGWTATGSLNWAATMATLADRFRVVVLDHRGHGRGIRDDDRFTLEDCADDAVALLDVLGVGAAIFVGYSMGGPIAQLIWRRHRERVNGLVLCATAADFSTRPDQQPLVGTLDQLQRAGRVMPPSVRRRVYRPLVSGLVDDPTKRDELLDAMSSHEQRTILEAGRAIRRFRSTDWIGEIDVPVVVVVTGRDRLVRPARQRQLARAIPGAHTITVDAGHLAAFTCPDLIADAVATGCDQIASRIVVPTRRHRFRRAISRLLRGRRGRPHLPASVIGGSAPSSSDS